MPSYLHPGVYIEETPSASKPIEGVSTSIAAFVGTTFRGPANTPILIGSWNEYVSQFGDYSQSCGVTNESDHMALAVRAFYQNGGKAAYICRILEDSNVNTPTAATVNLQEGGGDVLSVTASSEGTWGNALRVAVNHDGDLFELHIGTEDASNNFVPLATGVYRGLSMNPDEDNFVEKVVNNSTSLISVAVLNDATANPDANTLANGVFTDFEPLVSGAQAGPAAADYLSFYNNILRKYRDVSILVLPGQQWSADNSGNDFITNTISHCESTMSRMVIVDPPANTELVTGNDVNTMGLPTSTYSVLYYPWVNVSNPLYHPDSNPTASKTVTIPPSAIAAAMWAKIDNRRGVWKAPAGVETRVNVSGLQYSVEDLEQDGLNPKGVNCLRSRPSYGPVFWGSRTLATNASPEWRYVPVRRTAIFIEQSIFNGIQWSVFEPNDHPLWSALRANISSFMNGLFRAGAFQGKTADEAYFVRCGLGDTMTQGDIDRGQVIIQVGFAPIKPAEFVILRIQQKVDQQ
ncbi:phage tail sheath family protein [Pseudoalteromonas sp. GB56]